MDSTSTEQTSLHPMPEGDLAPAQGQTDLTDPQKFLKMHAAVLMLPLAVGLAFYGWRAAASVAVVVGSSVLAGLIWRRIEPRGIWVRLPKIAWLSLLVAMLLPPHLLASRTIGGPATWPILAAAGITLVIINWLLGGLDASGIFPALLTILLISAIFRPMLTSHLVLRRDRLFTGDLNRIEPAPTMQAAPDSWSQASSTPRVNGADALIRTSPAEEFSLFAAQPDAHGPDDVHVNRAVSLLRSQVPLEDLIIGGQAAPIGNASGVAVILAGLILIHLGLIDFLVPLFAVFAAVAAFTLLPAPILGHISALQLIYSAPTGWQAAAIFILYEIFASPLLLTIFFLAAVPTFCPTSRGRRALFALLLGATSAAMQFYVSIPLGPYLALLLVAVLISARFPRQIGKRN